MAWSIAYETTALGLSPLGGMATVCRQTLSEMKKDGSHAITGYFRHGRAQAITATGATAHRWHWYSRLIAPPFDLHHGLCHRLLPIRARARVLSVYDAWSLYPNPYQSPSFQRRAEQLLRKALTDADRVVTSSEATRSRLLDHADLSAERVSVIYPGAGTRAKCSSVPPCLDTAHPFVLFVGRLEFRKNLCHVVEAVRPIRELRLVVVGTPGFGFESDAEPALKSLSSDRLLTFASVADSELRWLYENAVALLQPSWEEGFGLPVLEALSQGCPVITSSVSATAEIAGTAAMLVDPNEPGSSTQYVSALLSDPTMRQHRREAGLSRAGEFSWNQYRSQLLGLYDRLLS